MYFICLCYTLVALRVNTLYMMILYPVYCTEPTPSRAEYNDTAPSFDARIKFSQCIQTSRTLNKSTWGELSGRTIDYYHTHNMSIDFSLHMEYATDIYSKWNALLVYLSHIWIRIEGYHAFINICFPNITITYLVSLLLT